VQFHEGLKQTFEENRSIRRACDGATTATPSPGLSQVVAATLSPGKILFVIYAPQEDVMSNKETALKFVERVINGHDLNAIDQVLSADFVEHSALPGFASNRAGVKEMFGHRHAQGSLHGDSGDEQVLLD
jgi:hypothetical protein